MAHILGMVSEVWRNLWPVPGWSRSRWQYCDPDRTPWPLSCRQSMRVNQAALRGSPVLASYHPLHCHPLGRGCHFESVCWLTLQHFTPAYAGWRMTLWLSSFHNTYDIFVGQLKKFQGRKNNSMTNSSYDPSQHGNLS